jgi:hypothetical protein
LLFYEAAEGGAGVLTRLANDSTGLASVARNALQLLHYNPPADGVWDVDELPALEQTDVLGNHMCEAGCYKCLLSYFNQPDHEYINRRHPDVLKLLVALANAQVQLRCDSPDTGVPVETLEDGAASWFMALKQAGLNEPDAVNVPVNQGATTAAAQYKSTRALVFLEPITADTLNMLKDKGWQALDFTDPDRWQELFTAHADVFGAKG